MDIKASTVKETSRLPLLPPEQSKSHKKTHLKRCILSYIYTKYIQVSTTTPTWSISIPQSPTDPAGWSKPSSLFLPAWQVWPSLSSSRCSCAGSNARWVTTPAIEEVLTIARFTPPPHPRHRCLPGNWSRYLCFIPIVRLTWAQVGHNYSFWTRCTAFCSRATHYLIVKFIFFCKIVKPKVYISCIYLNLCATEKYLIVKNCHPGIFLSKQLFIDEKIKFQSQEISKSISKVKHLIFFHSRA